MMSKKYKIYLIFICVLVHNLVISRNRVVATIGVGDSPSGMAITPDSRFVYVANNNFDGIPNGSSVSVIDAKTNTVITTITDPSFNAPYAITINPAGTKVYVANSGSTTLTIIDIASNTVSGIIEGFNGPSGMAITPDGTIGYVNNYGLESLASTVNVVDLNNNVIVGETITVDLAPASLAITPDGKFVYTINYVDGNPGTGTSSIIETSTNTVVGTITGFSGPFNIAITPNGKYAYITNFGSNNFAPYGTTVSVVNLKTNTITDTIQLGIQPAGIAITPNGKFAYVSNYNTLYLGPDFTALTPGQGIVNVIDTATNKVVCQKFIVCSSPGYIAISPNGKRAYVSNYSSANVSVLDIYDKMWLNVCNKVCNKK